MRVIKKGGTDLLKDNSIVKNIKQTTADLKIEDYIDGIPHNALHLNNNLCHWSDIQIVYLV